VPFELFCIDKCAHKGSPEFKKTGLYFKETIFFTSGRKTRFFCLF